MNVDPWKNGSVCMAGYGTQATQWRAAALTAQPSTTIPSTLYPFIYALKDVPFYWAFTVTGVSACHNKSNFKSMQSVLAKMKQVYTDRLSHLLRVHFCPLPSSCWWWWQRKWGRRWRGRSRHIWNLLGFNGLELTWRGRATVTSAFNWVI
jgi:hypothetical protein